MTSADDLLLEQIVRELRKDAQSVRRFHPDAVEAITSFRSLGRKAGRTLGWKVRTFQLDPVAPNEAGVVVVVAVIESSPLHQELMRVRGEKAIRRAFDLFPGTS